MLIDGACTWACVCVHACVCSSMPALRRDHPRESKIITCHQPTSATFINLAGKIYLQGYALKSFQLLLWPVDLSTLAGKIQFDLPESIQKVNCGPCSRCVLSLLSLCVFGWGVCVCVL